MYKIFAHFRRFFIVAAFIEKPFTFSDFFTSTRSFYPFFIT